MHSSEQTDITTLTTNPAIDLTVTMGHLTIGEVNRAQSMRTDPGGKGVMVAMRLADYGRELGWQVTATGFLGAENAKLFEGVLERKHISDAFVRVVGQTRTNVKIIDVEAHHQTTDINAQGITANAAAMEELMAQIDSLAAHSAWFVIGGKLQSSLPPTLYADIITRVKQAGCAVVLDSSGEAFAHGIRAGATLIKPNIHELSELLGRPLHDTAEVRQAAMGLLNDDTRMVVVSMGERGALFVTADEQWLARPPQIEVQSTVGAGDAMVAGILAGVMQGMSLAGTARLATAFSLAAVSQLARDLPTKDVLEAWAQQVEMVRQEPTQSL